MFNDDNIVVGLEIGTHKICAAVGEMNDDGGVNIIGLGQAKSNGVRKGEICDPEKVELELRTAIDEAEQMANAEIRNVFLGVSGGHVRGFNNRGNHTVLSSEHEISEDDVQDVIRNAKAINLAAEDTVIHAVRQHFYVDGQEFLASPVGICGSQLAVDMHVIHGKATRFQNAIRLVRTTQLEVNEIVFNGLATALALLTAEQKEIGALVIDIGAGTTEYVVYADNAIRFSGVLAVGGDHVSNDIAFGVKVSLSRAEQLKREHGSALVRADAKGQVINVTSDIGQVIKSVNVEHMQRIMFLRLEELFPPRPHGGRGRHHEHAGPAGIRHRHRPREIRLDETAPARRARRILREISEPRRTILEPRLIFLKGCFWNMNKISSLRTRKKSR
jgi:cell division protein FtsA